jgi:hypothetical protein
MRIQGVRAKADNMIDKLEFLIALACEQHFGRAAGACGVAEAPASILQSGARWKASRQP